MSSGMMSNSMLIDSLVRTVMEKLRVLEEKLNKVCKEKDISRHRRRRLLPLLFWLVAGFVGFVCCTCSCYS